VKRMTSAACVLLAVLAVMVGSRAASGRNNIRTTFLNNYPAVVGTQLDDLPSKTDHCGVCHFNFNGGGARNPYGARIEVGLNGGLNNLQAIVAAEGYDSDVDGFTSLVEITHIGTFANTPTFPGLSSANVGSTSNTPLAQIQPYLTPAGGPDTTPPDVTVITPNGGQSIAAESTYAVTYTASDAGGVSHVDVFLSEDAGVTFKPVATSQPPAGGYSWFVPNRPGSANRIRVVAYDTAGNAGHDDSDASFTITATPAGYVPTTLRDVDLPGTQPHEGAIFDDPDLNCGTCHGNYNSAVEPWYNWRGSMMAQAARDPLFLACLAVAEQDAPSVGDLCIRCHTPGGWQEGRSVDTSAGLLTAKDRHGVQCDFCHRAVDHNYVAGVSPARDADVLATVSPVPLQYGNGQFVNDWAAIRRGPYSDAPASHDVVESPYHRSSDLCGVCHDVSNPVFAAAGPGNYVPTAFDQPHPDFDVRNMGPVERTYSEWSQSEYASVGVYAPQFAGNKPGGVVSTCQDCHMRDVVGAGANEEGTPTRTDLALHDLMGGNTFVTDIVGMFYPSEVDAGQLAAARDRAVSMLQKAVSLTVTPEDFGVTVRVTNETGHKLPSGYPEGRRIWLNVRAYDALGQMVFESGEYNATTGVLHHDEQAVVYEIHGGLSPALALALGLPTGPSFHFVLNDTVYHDNRIPPRGFTNAAFQTIQSPPVGHAYADGQHWDEAGYNLPAEAESAHVTLYYQTTSKEYVEFLRDANTTNSAGQDLYNAWIAQGRAAPVAMAHARVAVDVLADVPEAPGEAFAFTLESIYPNPFNPAGTLRYSLAERSRVRIAVYDVAGRLVRTLVDEVRDVGRHAVAWDGRSDAGTDLASAVYFVRYDAGGRTVLRKAALLR